MNRRHFILTGAAVLARPALASAAELKAGTISAFNRYQAAAEASITADFAADRFLRGIRGNEAHQRESLAQLRRGQVVVEKLTVLDASRKRIDIPDGLLHHWVATAFNPGIRLDQAVAMMQDYDDHSELFRPNVVRSKTLEHAGDHFKIFLRFFFKKVISVTVNTESTADFTRHAPDRVSSAIRSTKINEVENPDGPNERELPVGQDGGFLWRLNTYWRFLERDGGTYVECESLTLTRGIPMGLGWIIGPFITSIPRETLTMTLEATRRGLQKPTSR